MPRLPNTTFRFDGATLARLRRLAEKMGMTRAAAVREALRRMAKQEGVR
jgi:predicted transcriptional regulator